MIAVTRFNGTELWVNALLVERIEQTPDTLVTMTTGRQFVVKETPEALASAIAAYVRSLQNPHGENATGGDVSRLIR